MRQANSIARLHFTRSPPGGKPDKRASLFKKYSSQCGRARSRSRSAARRAPLVSSPAPIARVSNSGRSRAARRFFKQWFGWVSRSRLKPLIKVARMLKAHLENLLTYLRHPITDAVTEGLNSKIQTIKSNARGFRSFENYRIRILFFCGKLNIYPL